MAKTIYTGCSVEGCNNRHEARTYCNKHYMQWKRLGNPLARSRHPRTKYEDNICTLCKTQKPFDQFPLRKNGNRYSWCKSCSKKYAVARKYRLTIQELDQMFDNQGNCCAACKTKKIEYIGNNATWHVDHDHSCCPGEQTCGKCIRGILCPACNRALGHAQNSIDRLQGLIKYLQDYDRLAEAITKHKQ